MADPFRLSEDYELGYQEGFEDGKDFIKRNMTRSQLEITNPPVSRTPKKRTRKASAYNKMYAKVYKSLKKKHPRTSFAALAKKAHKETKRRMKR